MSFCSELGSNEGLCGEVASFQNGITIPEDWIKSTTCQVQESSLQEEGILTLILQSRKTVFCLFSWNIAGDKTAVFSTEDSESSFAELELREC